MDRPIMSGSLSKFSMGRSIGINPQNWKVRFFRLTSSSFAFLESTPDSAAKFECPLSAISIVFANPQKDTHPQAVGKDVALMFAVRLFDNGVFTLLCQAPNREEKEKWLQGLNDAVSARSKGFQFVP